MVLIMTTGCGADKIAPPGIVKGRLAPCPSSPNCVSSQAESKDKLIAPIRYQGAPEDARQKLVKVLEAMSHVEIKTDSDLYIHAVFRSAVFGFADDVEFQIAPDQHCIHVRSAARTGYYDFGVNRRRIEDIRKRFEAKE